MHAHTLRQLQEGGGLTVVVASGDDVSPLQDGETETGPVHLLPDGERGLQLLPPAHPHRYDHR